MTPESPSKDHVTGVVTPLSNHYVNLVVSLGPSAMGTHFSPCRSSRFVVSLGSRMSLGKIN